MQKRILTMFWYDDAGEVHLYKDVGGIPYALAKYCGWQATFAYNDANGVIHNEDYEKYVKLDRIRFPKILERLKLRYIKYFQVIKYVYLNASNYDVINFYHCHKFINFLCWLAKKRNPEIITYVKLDMGKAGFKKEAERQKCRGGVNLWCNTDLFTVETKKYVDTLNSLNKFNNKVKYLPNGFFSDLVNIDLSSIKKEKIILTVARMGDSNKNTELLIESLEKIDIRLLENWKIYLVGTSTKEFLIWLDKKLSTSPELREKIIMTGHIFDKNKLYEIYQKSNIFIMPSRSESWGLALTEAMHFSNFVIVTDCCEAFYEILSNGKEKFGTIVKNQDVDSLKAAIIDSIINIDKKINIAKKGKIFVDSNFNWNVIATRLDNYFKGLK